ncbi:MAG TPA: SRPBCC family protein [Candidatus Acidoferrum sp.]|nr:SRPBCC family protein [Candidatus Acidoferrum sp.]
MSSECETRRNARDGGSQARALQGWGMLLGGSALALYAVTRRRPSIALAAAGGLIAYRGAKMETRKFHARSSFAVNCSPETAYQFWRVLENLPIFMRYLESVRGHGNGRSEWTAVGPMNTRVRWKAELTEDRENEFLAWRSTQDSDFQHWISVEFRRAPGNRGTIVTAEMEYEPPAGVLGKAALAIFGKGPEFNMREDLRRFKALIEMGEIPTTQGQPHGPRSTVVSAIDAVQPEQREPSEYQAGERMAAQRRAS